MQNKEKQLKALFDSFVVDQTKDFSGQMGRDEKLILIMDQIPVLLPYAWEELCRPPRKNFDDAMLEDLLDRESERFAQKYPVPLSLVEVIVCIPVLRKDAWRLLCDQCTIEGLADENNNPAYYLNERLVEVMRLLPECRPMAWSLIVILIEWLLANANLMANRSSITDCCVSVMVSCQDFTEQAWRLILRYANGEDFLKVMKLVPAFRQRAWEQLMELDDPKDKDSLLCDVAREFPEFRQKANEIRVQLDPAIQKMAELAKA